MTKSVYGMLYGIGPLNALNKRFYNRKNISCGMTRISHLALSGF